MRNNNKQFTVPLMSLVFFLVCWESIVSIVGIERWLLPTPSQVFVALWESRQLLLRHLLVTIIESVVGLILAITFAWGAAAAMYFSDFFKKSLLPLFVISQTIPFIALAPLLVVWFGFGLLPKVIIVALVCFFPIAINLIDGFNTVEKSIINNLLLLGADRRQIFKFVIIPASSSFFFSGLRIAGSYALVTAVVSEWIGASQGLGVFMIRSAKSYQIDQVFAAIIVVSAISLVAIFLIDQIYRMAAPWRFIKS